MINNKVAIFGLGRVGLPLALILAERGFSVSGVDVDSYKIKLLQHGIMPFWEDGGEGLLKKHQGASFQVFPQEHLHRIVSENRFLIITLGTPIDDSYSPNFEQIEDLFLKISPSIQKGQVIILRSTISPGTTEQLARQLEEHTRLKIGKNLFLAYCPERIAEGHSIQELSEIPQIIGVLDEHSKNETAKIFSKIAPEILFTNARSAELAKLFCNMYRYIDFAIGNEFMMIAEDHGCDIYEVLHLVNDGYKRGGLKPPGFTAGPCLVKDGFFLIDKSPYMELVTAAWRMNENIPGYLLERIKHHISNLHKKKVALLGLAFKRDIDDARSSLTPKMKRHFLAEGATVSVHDPFIDSSPLEETLKDADILVITMNHNQFRELDPEFIKNLVKKNCLACDVWDIFGTGKIIFPVQYLGNNIKTTKAVPDGKRRPSAARKRTPDRVSV